VRVAADGRGDDGADERRDGGGSGGGDLNGAEPGGVSADDAAAVRPV